MWFWSTVAFPGSQTGAGAQKRIRFIPLSTPHESSVKSFTLVSRVQPAPAQLLQCLLGLPQTAWTVVLYQPITPRENNVRSSPRFLFQPLDCSPCRFSLNFQGTVRSFPTSTSLPSGPEMPIRRSLLLRQLTVFKLPSLGSVQRVSPSAKVPDIFRN